MDVSFVVSLYNCLGLTQAMLTSLRKTIPSGLSHELILVDDGSTDGTRDFLSTLKSSATVLLNEQNLGYAASNNRAVNSAQGRLLFLLNNDLVLQTGWMEPMLAAFHYCRDLGVVGNRQLDAKTGALDHAGMIFHCDGYPIHFRDPDGTHRQADYQRFPAVTAACCAVRRDLFLSHGGFSTEYRNGFEDVDLCLRMHAQGRRNLVAHQSQIRHHISSSPGRQTHEKANAQHFLAKWRPLTSVLEREWLDRLSDERRILGEARDSDAPRERYRLRQKLLSGNYCLYRRSRILRRLRPTLPKLTATSAP